MKVTSTKAVAMETGDHFKNGASLKSRTSRVKFSIAVMLTIFSLITTSAIGQSYNAAKAVAYSEKWTNEINDNGSVRKSGAVNTGLQDKPNYRNPDYDYSGTKNSTGIQYGNDCANFVSQCLQDEEGGGLDVSNYKTSGSNTITNCVPLHQYLRSAFPDAEYTTSTVTSNGPTSVPSWLAPGDIVIWWDRGVGLYRGSGGTNHTAIVATNDKLLNAHTSNRWHRDLSWFGSGSSWSYISYYHISAINAVSNERPAIDITIPNNSFTDNKKIMHGEYYNNEEVVISVGNANVIGRNNIKIVVKGINGEPTYSDNDPQAYYGSTQLRFFADDRAPLSANQWYWHPSSGSVAWNDKWVKIVAVNTRGYDNSITDPNHWNTNWLQSEPRYVRIVPRNVGVDNLRPWVTSIDNQTVNNNNINEVNTVSFSNDISLLIDGRGYVGNNSWEAWEDNINISYVILNGTPNYSDPYSTETPYNGINGTYRFFSDEENHNLSVANKFHLYPETRSEWEGRYVKIMPWNTQYSIWGKPRYIKIIPTLATLTVSQGTLSPAFNPDVANYTVNVVNSVSSITLSAIANSTATTTTGIGNKSLNVGTNTYNIIVAGNNGASKTYTVTVNRAAAEQYTVSYIYNGATGGNTTTSKSVTYNSPYGTLPSPTKQYTVTYNYNGSGQSGSSPTYSATFGGWYKEAAFTNQVTATTTVTTSSNHTIYAKWTDGTALTLPTPNARTGYTFTGWYTSASGGTKAGNAGASYRPTANITLYAQWTTTIVVPTNVTLNQNTATLTVGNTLQLTATVQPTNATNKNVSWSSSNTSVATVNSNGLVTGVAAGNATITVTTEEGNKQATCSVTIIPGISNDLCTNATNLSCGATVSGTLAGATPSTIYGNYGTFGDVFYQFTAAYSGNHTITFTKTNSSDDIDVIVYQGCSSTTEITSIADNNITETKTFNCTAGTNYRIRVVASGTINGTFSIKVDCPYLSNDLCTNATNLSCGATVSGTLAGATPTTSVTYSLDRQSNDVFYKFTATHTGTHSITLTKSNPSDDIDVQLFQSCNESNYFAILNGNNTSEFISFSCTADDTYYFRVLDIFGTGGTFTLKIDCPNPTPAQANLQLLALAANGTLYQNQTGSFTATLKNNGDAAYNSHLWVYLEKWAVYTPNQSIDGGIVSIAAGETKTITISGIITLPPDIYALNMKQDYNNDPSNMGTVQFDGTVLNLQVAVQTPSYTIKASAEAGGTISPSGNISVEQGNSQTFTFSPDNCYEINQVLIDGTANATAKSNGSHTFSNVTADHTISVSFTQKSYSITASAGSGGSISPNGTASVNCGDSKTYTITPNSGYHVSQVLVDGSNAGAISSYTFSNVTANHTISVSF
ncbi:MAG: Ig-like domain-containing protein, partial [Tannerella sp.]|nr:Ig-like domain-containing protein [Tannerella sp.]